MQQENVRLQKLLNSAVLSPAGGAVQQSIELMATPKEDDSISDAVSLQSASSSLGMFAGGLPE